MRTLRALVAAALLCLLPVLPAHAADRTYDFEDGTTQGWGPRGDGVSVTVTPEAARTGTGGLAVSGRTATWHGASITAPFAEGVGHTVTAYARLAPGQPAGTIAMTVQRTPAGGETTYERVAAATVTDGAWVPLSGGYQLPAGSTDVQLYIESSDATTQYLVDDIVLRPLGDPTREPITSDFEDGTAQSWATRAAAVLEVGTTAHAGARGLTVTGRSASWDGPALNVLGRLGKGDKYALSAWVRLGPDTASGKLGLSIERRTGGTPSYERVVAPKDVPAGQWVQLSGTYTLAHDADFLSVYVESDTGTFPFHLDDFTLTYVEPKPIQTGLPSLKDELPFTIGSAFTRPETLGVHGELLAKHFDGVTPGNELKWDATEPREGEFTFTDADHLVSFATEHGMTIRGHTLAWHSQTPAWVFENATKEVLLERLERHVRTLVTRYKGRIAAWDVVNEVVDENQPDGLRRSPWYEIAGLDFIRTAFRVAREADPDAKLFINDYNTEFPRKREALYKLVKQLKDEGVPIDGVGHQLHLNIEHPPASAVEATIERFAPLGLDQQVTELDVSIYTDFVSTYDTIPPELLVEQGYRYKELFDVFRRQADRLSSVTVWGESDDVSWLRSWPIPRLNAPLLFDDDLQAKPAYWGVVDPSRLDPLVRKLEAPAAVVKVDGKRDLEWDLLPDAPLARVGDVSAGFQARSSAAGLYLLAEVTDPAVNAGDRVTFTVDGRSRTLTRTSPGVRGTATGYRAEALLAGGTDVQVAVHDRGTRTTWTGRLTPTAAVKRTTAPHRQAPPVLDGAVDRMWSGVPEIRTGTWIQGTSGATAKVRSLWSGSTLYVLAQVTDPELSESSANPWEQDSVELFVDPGNGKTKGYEDDDGQYRVSFSGRVTVGGTFDAAGVKDNVRAAAVTVPGGYVVEAAIHLPTVTLEEGALVGFDVQVNDATGAARTAAVTWNDATRRSYLDTSHWGVARLGG
ncbi:endo-1,4-beta-xylanase [Nonomuraea gerenzanensis]|uniref:Beta-xylanase n=1 Tax=Nonomuraea gerenzanensis TaxID=93944 RepID=A0A1M4E4A8_9ACTN|nr:endo-1,4-beta-xylanase [Nonomuraea gerenzanensis]UBU15879.1 endo-1,4-beta-xylanase [Nonomuraea gerenzanensis]SBO93671.1 Endo-1,4-beta-xylanase A precursor [Nonomuraea gerenzanensis]